MALASSDDCDDDVDEDEHVGYDGYAGVEEREVDGHGSVCVHSDVMMKMMR